MSQKQFAFTGASPKQGYVGFVNISETENGISFLVRSEGENPPTASYEVPKADGVRLLSEALKGMAGEWLDINSAPKDGRAVLLRFPHHPVSIGRFEYGAWTYAFCMTEGGDSPDGWQPIPAA